MDEIILVEAPPRHLAIKNRKLDRSNAYDAAVFEFVFRYNLRADGFSNDEIETRWNLFPGSRKAHEVQDDER